LKRIFHKYNAITHGSAFLITLLVLMFFSACSAVTIDNDSPPEKQFEEGERLLKKERYLEAVERYRILKSRFPYSKYAALATLRIGDAHYEEEAFLEASGAYKIFRELYPKHEMSAYALYRIGESQMHLVPSSPDRDLDSAYAAIDAYQDLEKNYPNSQYTTEAKQKIQQLRAKLADKEDYIGNFYFVRNNFLAAANRYKYILDVYPGFGHEEKSLYRLAFSYEKIGDTTKAEEVLERLKMEFPKGKFSEQAENLSKKIQLEKKE